MKLSPIVIFGYNRPHYFKETLDALKNNQEAKESMLYIFCDGPKTNATSLDLENIAEVRSIAKQINWCANVAVFESEKNNGLSESIINGVKKVLEKHESVIVLEDDLVVSPYFLNYMNTALNKYENNEEVISIGGFNYPIDYDDGFPATFFLKNADCFGWGTWRRAWNLFERDANILIKEIERTNRVKEFDFGGQYPFMKMLKNVANGKVGSWAIRWYGTSFINNKLSLFPKRSLVRHIGSVGTNFKIDHSDILGWDISVAPVAYYENKIEENRISRDKYCSHFRKHNRRRLSISTLKYIYKRFILSKFKW